MFHDDKPPVTNQNSTRLAIYLAISYFIVSALLFVVFYISGKTYFFNVQKDAVINRVQGDEGVFLYNILKELQAVREIEESQEQSYREVLKSLGDEKLGLIVSALESKLESLQKEASRSSPIEELGLPGETRSTDPQLTTGKLQLDVEIPEYFKSLAGKPGDMIIARLSGPNLRREPHPLEYLELAETSLHLPKGGKSATWSVTTYGKPYSSKDSEGNSKVFRQFEKSHGEFVRRLVVFPMGSQDPSFRGSNNVTESVGMELIEKSAVEKGDHVLKHHQPETKLVNSGGRLEEEVVISTVLADPELRMTLCLVNTIPEFTWTSYSFFERFKKVIWVYAILAWVIFPLAAYVAYRLAVKLRFKMTLDLEADEGDEDKDFHDSGYTRELSKTETPPVAHPPRVQETSHAQEKKGTPPAVETNSASHTKTSEPIMEPVNKDYRSSIFEELRPREHSMIRLNNIRKSMGTFNSSTEKRPENVDYLRGVQSDVLKSLIKRLRDS